MEAIGHLQQLTGLPVTRSENMSDTTSNLDAIVEVHATLKAHAVNLEKMVSDIRLLASDLTAGYFLFQPPEPSVSDSASGHASRVTRHAPCVTRHAPLAIPQRQAGSSIMPGKVNPVIPEFVISAAHRIYANDQLISSLCAQGCLELNAYLPLIGHALLDSIKLLIACDHTLKENLMDGLQVFAGQSSATMYRSPSVTTALVPAIGYHKATELAQFMKLNQCDIFEANRELDILPQAKLERLLKPENLVKLGFTTGDLA
jgi:aspartate ammonia-lyase